MDIHGYGQLHTKHALWNDAVGSTSRVITLRWNPKVYLQVRLDRVSCSPTYRPDLQLMVDGCWMQSISWDRCENNVSKLLRLLAVGKRFADVHVPIIWKCHLNASIRCIYIPMYRPASQSILHFNVSKRLRMANLSGGDGHPHRGLSPLCRNESSALFVELIHPSRLQAVTLMPPTSTHRL